MVQSLLHLSGVFVGTWRRAGTLTPALEQRLDSWLIKGFYLEERLVARVVLAFAFESQEKAT